MNLVFHDKLHFGTILSLNDLGVDTQHILESKKVVLFGCGAVGAKIIEILVRAGVKNIVLVDYKSLTKSNAARHCYYNYKKIGKPKVDVLSEFLS